ncbi:L-2-hydroxyglutarate dehydrogenase, mitochondrial [Hypsizygus marmoreus]|uniref:L-2-hydroxyglutarate dehydrogenase, mitochondrial n=1 Tax=Hypsizygus marmoreus TaxID=39966 RepID=A0A369JGQ5_HYPMA|nr:L-2-hydroxyglutarate dehydrogenase, mitochondrial [Hypsizygus marmoreus]
MQPLRGLTAALNGNGKFKYKHPESIVDFLVVGGGVVGLAIAQRLSQRFPALSTYLVERHSRPGEEISSRNSEVIHSGLYYPPDSLKTRLCLRGRDMIYERCKAYHIPHRKTGKLVVARVDQQSYIENLYHKSLQLGWPPHSCHEPGQPVLPTTLLSGDQARDLEPDLSKDIVAALWCPETGILDSHSFMESLEKDIIDSEGGDLVYSTSVVRVDPYEPSRGVTTVSDLDTRDNGWVVQTRTGSADDGDALLARTLINATGLSSSLILNTILPEAARIPMYYARGSYASYHGPGISQISHLIYPCPELGENAHAFHSLGTHLTLDLQGKVRFGPDIEWVSSPSSDSDQDADFWTKYLTPDESRLPEMHQAVIRYLPGVTLEGMQPDYVGMRPKLVPPKGDFQDFVFRTDYPTQRVTTNTSPLGGAMISLLGIESPGLTSSLAIAEYVVEDLLEAGGQETEQ